MQADILRHWARGSWRLILKRSELYEETPQLYEWSPQLSAQGNFPATMRNEPKLSRALSELRRQRSELQTTGEAGIHEEDIKERAPLKAGPWSPHKDWLWVHGWELSYTYTAKNPQGLTEVTHCSVQTWAETPEVPYYWDTVSSWPKRSGRTF